MIYYDLNLHISFKLKILTLQDMLYQHVRYYLNYIFPYNYFSDYIEYRIIAEAFNETLFQKLFIFNKIFLI